MADIKTPEERSKNMSAIKNAATKPEMYIRKMLFSKGYRYRVQATSIPGHPDLWLKKYNTAIFVHGCFWHRHMGCKYAYVPKSRTDFWEKKFETNRTRDQIVRNQLQKMGIRCLVIWECTIRNTKKKTGDPISLLSEIQEFLISTEDYKEI